MAQQKRLNVELKGEQEDGKADMEELQDKYEVLEEEYENVKQ